MAGLLVRMHQEQEVTYAARETWRLKQRITDLETMLEFGKPMQSVMSLSGTD